MIIEHDKEIGDKFVLEENTIIGRPTFVDDSSIQFLGKGNLLIVEDDVRISDSAIRFCGDNAIVYLSHNERHFYKLRLDVWRNTAVYFGANNYFNGPLSAVVSERQNLFVGNDGVFSFGVWVRTADPHVIYDVTSKKRINMSKSVVIGDHVWLGQNALLLKGVSVGSGSVISANCVLAGKKVESNVVFAGNPGKLVKRNIFFSDACVHDYRKKQTNDSMFLDSNEWCYTEDNTTLDVADINKQLAGCKTSEEKAVIIKKLATLLNKKNRFSIEPQKQSVLRHMKNLVK